MKASEAAILAETSTNMVTDIDRQAVDAWLQNIYQQIASEAREGGKKLTYSFGFGVNRPTGRRLDIIHKTLIKEGYTTALISEKTPAGKQELIIEW